MMKNLLGSAGRVLALGLVLPSSLLAQLPDANDAGIATGHIHLVVPDAAKHREIWLDLGAEATSSGRLQLLRFPGMFFLLREAEPTGPSDGTAANHVGFLVRDYDAYRAKLVAHDAELIVDNPGEGHVLADLPDGVRVEFRRDTSIQEPIVFHHIHLETQDNEHLRDWYVDVFGADVSSRRDMPSAVVPGGRVDVRASDASTAATQGRAIDHIGFEVANMDAFANRLSGMGIAFDREPAEIPAIGLTIAFITDPAGTYIELTQGLRGK